eukprot:TRINITY_DN74017_c0_g1_i1.p1 TRINITY_DN74017_c0_g1~~TRINITY_DN74017_c0_g1_i1.p1  ORF type:complete len:534 (+),score=100.60 TRINITY_DN74017_c0_g1_i1:115-1602(+)
MDRFCARLRRCCGRRGQNISELDDTPLRGDCEGSSAAAAAAAVAAPLRRLRQRVAECERLRLPAAAAWEFAYLRGSIDRLESHVRRSGGESGASPLPPAGWEARNPPPGDEELEAFRGLCPHGGALLLRRFCLCAEGEAGDVSEWHPGNLFVSSEGLLFEKQDQKSSLVKVDDIASLCDGSSTPAGSSMTGDLIAWADIASLEATEASCCQASLTLKKGLDRGAAALQLRLGTRREVSELAELLNHYGSREAFAGVEAETASGSTVSVGRTTSTSLSSIERAGSGGDVVAASVANAWLAEASASLPAPEAPNVEPLVLERLADVTLAQIRSALLADDWPIDTFMRENLKFFDVSHTSWSESIRLPGTLARSSQFMLPLVDLPRIIARLTKIPAASSATSVYNLRSSDDQVIMLQRTRSHDIKYGDCLVLEDISSYRTHPDGGVEFRQWNFAIWTGRVPAFLRFFVEKQLRADAIATAPAFLSVVCEASQKFSNVV